MVITSNEVFSYLQACRTGDERLPSWLLLNHDSSPDNAVEILQWLKKEKSFSPIPVVILSGIVDFGNCEGVLRTGGMFVYSEAARAIETETKMRSFLDYWFKVVDLPEGVHKN